MAAFDDVQAPKVIWVEGAAPGTPAAGLVYVYAKADGLMYSKDDAGVETLMSSGAVGSVATDAIWDVAGDLAVGSGANTAARLAIGAAGGALSRVNGAVAWNSGTAFPTAAAGDRYWRTDLNQEFFYNGTRWLTSVLHQLPLHAQHFSATVGYSGPTGSLVTFQFPTPYLAGGSDIWLVSLETKFLVNGGTALGASHKWVATLDKKPTGDTNTNVLTITVDSGSSSVWRTDLQSINALLDNGTTHYAFRLSWTITGTPGDIRAYPTLMYRIVAT